MASYSPKAPRKVRLSSFPGLPSAVAFNTASNVYPPDSGSLLELYWCTSYLIAFHLSLVISANAKPITRNDFLAISLTFSLIFYRPGPLSASASAPFLLFLAIW